MDFLWTHTRFPRLTFCGFPLRPEWISCQISCSRRERRQGVAVSIKTSCCQHILSSGTSFHRPPPVGEHPRPSSGLSRDRASVPDTPTKCAAGVQRAKVSNNEIDREPTSGAALSKCKQLRDGGSLVCQTTGLHRGGGGDVPSLCL